MLCRSRIPPRALERLVLAVGLFVAGCGTLPTAGPTARQVVDQESHNGEARFTLIEIDGNVVAARLAARKDSLRDRFPRHGAPPEPKIGIGDSLVVTLWEAAGGGLFTASGSADHVVSGSHSVTLPEQAVARDGAISVPFAGRIRAVGRLPLEVQHAIERRLSGKAIEPQAIVTLTKSVSNTATVSGEVVSGARVALSLKGDRLLDLVASAGGTRSPVYETAVRLSRRGVTVTVPLEVLVSNPAENIYAEPGDVLTVVRAPRTFTVFGATGQNSQINFTAAGVTLAEALAKAGGLQDARSDPAGVFLFRWEPTAIVEAMGRRPAATAADGNAPVVYRLNLRDASAYFAAERFPVEDKDIIYVANADLNEMQKFFGLINTLTGPAITGVVIRSTTQ